MKFPSATEKKILDVVGILWFSGGDLKARYVKKHGQIPNGTFYTMLRRLGESGWVRSRKPNPKCSEDGRQRYYCTTKQTQELKGKLDALIKALEPFENRKELKV